MKNLIALFSLYLISVFLFSQSAVLQLYPPIVVAGGNYNSTKPRIALVNDSTPIIMWGKPSPAGKIYVSKWNGTMFTVPLQVSPSALDTYTNANDGPNIAAKGDTVFITYFSMAGAITKVYINKSVDGGNTFSDTVRVDNQYPTSGKYAYSPYVAIGASGNPVMCYETSTSTLTLPEQLFNKSTDGGLTFPSEINADYSAPGEPCECCPPSITLKDSMVFMLYRNNMSNIRDIFCAISSDYGNTFPTAVRMDYNYWNINGCPSQGPEGYIWNDTLIATFMSDPGSFARINIGTLNTSTLQFGTNYYVDTNLTGLVVQRHPTIAGSGDTIGIAWEDTRNGNYDCFISVSLNGTAGFTNTIRISDTVTGNQSTPHIAYHNGYFHITYRNDATNQVIYRKAKIVGTLGAEEITPNSLNVKVYPNPFAEEATLRITNFNELRIEDIALQFYDLLGNKVEPFVIRNSDSFVIRRGNLSAGIYFLKITSDNKTYSQKIIIN